MDLLKKIFILFILSFPLTEIGRIQLSNGIAFSVNDILLGALISVWIVRIVNSKDTLKGFLLRPILLFVSIGLISLLLNLTHLDLEKFSVSFLYLLRFASYGLIYFIFKEFDKDFRKRVSFLLLFSGLITLLIGYLQFFLYPSLRNLYYLGWDEHLYRMFGSFLDPNFAGTFFVIYFIFSLSFIRDYLKKKDRLKLITLLAISLLSLSAVFLTYSRSALIMLFISLTIYLFLIKQKRLLMLFVVVLVLLIFLSPKSFQTEGTNILRITSSQARLKTVEQAVDIFKSSPIFGIGFNAYRYAQNQRGLDNIYWKVTHSGAGTDNSFLFVLATTGILGFSSFLYFIYKIVILGKLKLNKNRYGAVLLSVFIGLLVNSIFINSFFYVFILEWIFLLSAFTESS